MSEFALEEIAAERAAPGTAAPDGRGGRRSVPSQLLHNPLAVFSLVWLVIIIVVAIGAPWLAPYEPTFTKLEATNAPPFTPGHPLGGDAAGRDILSRLMWGSRQTADRRPHRPRGLRHDRRAQRPGGRLLPRKDRRRRRFPRPTRSCRCRPSCCSSRSTR